MTIDKKCSEYLIHLLDCAINNKTPAPKPDEVGWDELLSFAEYHSVANTACYSIEKLSIQPPDVIMKRWREIKSKAIVKDITQRTEYKAITGAFEKARIRVLTYKGFRIKNLYPRSDMRVMADLDILVDEENREAAGKLMRQMGYSGERKANTCHDNFFKPPVMSVELHRRLFSQMYEKMHEYASGAFERAEKDGESDYVYRMTDEEFCVFFFMHLYKHMSNGGSGIRSIMDCYMLNRSLRDTINSDCVHQRLAALELWDFTEQVSALSQMWFADAESTAQLDGLAEWVLSSGTYGTFSNSVEKQIKENGRAKLLLIKLFPSVKAMKNQYGMLRKIPVLLPFFWIWRLVTAMISRRKRAFGTMKLIMKKNG